MRIGVQVRRVGREVDAGQDGLQVEVDPRLGARLLHDLLRLLARRVHRGLVHELELLAVLGADAVGAALPARGLEELVGLLDVELPLRVLRDEPRRRVHEIGGGDAGAPVDLLLYRAAVDQEIERLAHGEIAQDRVLGLVADNEELVAGFVGGPDKVRETWIGCDKVHPLTVDITLQ